MSIYHCSIKIISRSGGRSAVASAAYRSGEKLRNEETGLIHDFTNKGGVVMNEIMLPENAPKHLGDRSCLWNEVQQDESELIKEKAEEIANPRILTVKRKCEDAKTKMKHRHEEDTRNLKKWLLFLFAYAVSMTMLVVSLYASEVLNKTSEQLILVTVIIHGIYLYLRVRRDT